MDMTKFCAKPEDPRFYLQSLISFAGKTIASDGATLIYKKSSEPESESGLTANLKAKLKEIIADIDTYKNWQPANEKPEINPDVCKTCDGEGLVRITNCPECDGAGEVFLENAFNYYECDCATCNGKGTVKAGEPKVCGECNGAYVNKCDDPLTTITTKAEHLLVAAHLSPQYGGGYNQAGQPVNKPMPTVTAVDHNVLVTSHLVNMRGTLYGKMLSVPAPTITAIGTHLGIINAAFIVKYYGTNFGHPADQPLQTITAKHRFGLAKIRQINPPLNDDQRYQAWWCARFMDDYGPAAGKPQPIIIAPRRRWVTAKNGGILIDISMRMLEPRELFRAQGFPDNYIIDRDADGNPYRSLVISSSNSCPPRHISGRLALTSASANGGGTALPQRATCLYFGKAQKQQST